MTRDISPDLDALLSFVLDAKRHTYAAQGDAASVAALLPGSRQLEYHREPFSYRDIYFGGEFFVGQETVYQGGAPVWAMGYGGGLLPVSEAPVEATTVYDFLRTALRQVTPERPFRGPGELREGAFAYTSESHGEIDRFWGVETITYGGHLIYELRYSGGLLR